MTSSNYRIDKSLMKHTFYIHVKHYLKKFKKKVGKVNTNNLLKKMQFLPIQEHGKVI